MNSLTASYEEYSTFNWMVTLTQSETSVGKSNMLIIGTVMNADAPRRDVLKSG